MKSMALPIVILSAGVLSSSAQAATWCSTNWPDAAFCDDFDGYVDGREFSSEWDETGPCASTLTLDTDFVSSSPYSGKMNTQENGTLGHALNGIAGEIRNHFGPACTSGAVVGTDLHPLVLELVMNGQSPVNRAPYNNSFLTLTTGYVAAPTNWAWSGFCSCPSSDARYPIICQQESPAAACPPIEDAPSVPAIAVGFLAYLDSDPCHCSGSWHSPINEHLSFFDGTKWYRLRQGLFPGSGDFKVRGGENRIKITMKSSTIKVELTCPNNSEYSWCQLPGGFTGPFSAMSTGFHVACQLEADTWNCRGDPSCSSTRGVPNGGVPRYDNIVLHGGTCYAPPGACCFPNTSCTEGAYAGDCLAMGGQPGEAGSTCAATACCPPLLPDHDMDEDVDLADFGWFQTCLAGEEAPPPTIPCQCADFNHDSHVDAFDVSTFLGCLLGPEIPADPNCVP